MENNNLLLHGAYIKRVLGEMCGPNEILSKILYYRNVHPSWTIKITIDHHYLYNGEEIHNTLYETLLPNPTHDYTTPHELDKKMGCMLPGPTPQTFHWDVIDAVIV